MTTSRPGHAGEEESIAAKAAGMSLDTALRPLDPVERIRSLRERVTGDLVFTTSFGLEDQVLTHMIAAAGVAVRIVTLDTGRLFPETHALWSRTEARYGFPIRAFYPDTASVEDLVARRGIDGFYGTHEARTACCGVRKVAPLGRALQGAAAWITGLRAGQSDARRDIAFASFDPDHRLLKINPLLDWSRDRVAAYARTEDVPVNPLHDQGFLSIGCAPCTRAVRPGEPERAGRWWWEHEAARECGLHLTPDGRLVRAGSQS